MNTTATGLAFIRATNYYGFVDFTRETATFIAGSVDTGQNIAQAAVDWR